MEFAIGNQGIVSNQADKQALAAQQERVREAMMKMRAETDAYKRMAKAPPLFLHERIAKPLRPDALTDAKLFADRNQMMQHFVSGGVGVEVGVQRGIFSRFLLDQIKPDKLFLLDLYADDISADVLDDPRTELLLGDSSTQLMTLEDRSTDWIYIDGDHSYPGAFKDTEAARRKIKQDGLIIFNDYTPWSIGEVMPYGVMAVVNDLVNEGYPIVGLALASHGYFDVAVRYSPLAD